MEWVISSLLFRAFSPPISLAVCGLQSLAHGGHLFRPPSLRDKGDFLACNGGEACGRLGEVFQVISLAFIEDRAQK